MRKLVVFCLLVGLFFSCDVKPQEIEYGVDACHYCSMTIVDKQHAAELVTKKGKVFKFDAAECMIHHISNIDATKVALYFVTDYNSPGQLIDSKTATFIISENIPSPMRANLSALLSREEGELLQVSKGGDLYSWNEICSHLKRE